jgi:IrrE N-terminal-like domain
MSGKPASANDQPGDGRSVENLIRAALRTDGLLVPQTVEEVKRFEEELARNPVEVPAHVLTAEWLFGAGCQSAELPASPTPVAAPCDDWSVAARDGGKIPAEVAARMRDDRAGHDAQQTLQPGESSDRGEEVLQFASAPRLREIAELAEWIARECCPVGLVDPTTIAARNGIGLSFNDYEEAFDGLLEHRAGRFHVYCNLRRVESDESDRARFTIGHELGHFHIDAHRWVLEQGRSLPLSQCDYESAEPIEREADHFAAHLLMPSNRFVKQARGMKPGLPTVLSLRKHFGTSVTSTACRYATVGLTPCVVVKWSKDGFAWRCMSMAAREAGFRTTIQSASALPPESPTARALAGESPPASGFFEAGTTAATWFRSVTHGSFRNAILVEQAIPLGRFGALTLLYPEDGALPQSA